MPETVARNYGYFQFFASFGQFLIYGGIQRGNAGSEKPFPVFAPPAGQKRFSSVLPAKEKGRWNKKACAFGELRLT